jgi:uncharacterized protein (TIGR00725 family)
MGPGAATPRALELGYRVGALVAERGGLLICGGRAGVMEAAARGAREAGGITIGILPGESASEANPSIDIPIVTGLGNARNAVNVLTSQAIIAIAGSFGTLSEIALALKCGTPVVGLETWAPVPPGETACAIPSVETPEEAVALAFELAWGRA